MSLLDPTSPQGKGWRNESYRLGGHGGRERRWTCGDSPEGACRCLLSACSVRTGGQTQVRVLEGCGHVVAMTVDPHLKIAQEGLSSENPACSSRQRPPLRPEPALITFAALRRFHVGVGHEREMAGFAVPLQTHHDPELQPG